MSFREAMQVSPSNAEITVGITLQQKGLHKGMMKDHIILLESGSIVDNRFLTRKMVKNFTKEFTFTTPDFLWSERKLAVYLDGPVHKRQGVMRRDEKINDRLFQLGFGVMRFKFTPPLSKKRLAEIVGEIEEALK